MRAIGVGNDAESEIDSRIVGVYANVGVGANVDCDADGSIVRVYVNVGEAIEADGDIDCRKDAHAKCYMALDSCRVIPTLMPFILFGDASVSGASKLKDLITTYEEAYGRNKKVAFAHYKDCLAKQIDSWKYGSMEEAIEWREEGTFFRTSHGNAIAPTTRPTHSIC
ncbi:hypothetical protein V6N13_043133 [Hibiscus sabdariffa]